VAHLSIKELSKRNNFQTFVYRIAIGQGFYLVNTDILVKLNKSILDNITCFDDLNNYKVGNSIQLPTETNDLIPLSMLYKDSDFSNRTQYTTAKQDKQINNVAIAINNIKEKTGLDYVSIKIIDQIYNIKDVKSLEDKSKADLCFIDLHGNEVGYVSHKHGISPKDFQQWSGTSKRFQQEIYDHPETKDFIYTLKTIFDDYLPPASSVARKIKDDNLKNIAVFGNDFGKEFGKNNVEAVMQGELKLFELQDYYALTGSHYTIKNGDIPLYGYEPVFMAVHKRDRSDHWIKNCRVTINPLGSRKIKLFI
jgi:hypothetical protein